MTNVNTLAALDLNLLVVLDAVLATGSATRAAQRLNVTQSAVSNALRRLRDALGDPLVVRSARGLTPTPRAAAMAPTLRAWLAGGLALVSERAPDADSADALVRRFTIATTDALAATLMPRLLPRFAKAFPRARLRVMTVDRVVLQGGLAGGEADLLVGAPPTLAPGCRSEPLYRDRMVCILRADHPTRRLTLEAYASLPHCEVALFGEPHDQVDRALARVGRSRSVLVAVPHFAVVPVVVAASDCVATLPERVARAFMGPRALRVAKPPVAVTSEQIVTVWHRRVDDDGAVTQLRALLRAAAGMRSPG
ncbi:MAG: LysR family transcriptional regulator [Myxococcota bacterium]